MKVQLKKIKESFKNRGTITHMSRDANPDYPEFRQIKRKDFTVHRRDSIIEEVKNSPRSVANKTIIAEQNQRDKSPLIST